MAREHLRIVAAGDESAVPANLTADYLNHRSADEPLAARQPGPDGLNATMRWLQRAFADMRFEVHEFALNGTWWPCTSRFTLLSTVRSWFTTHPMPA
jgi:hypothetical protein